MIKQLLVVLFILLGLWGVHTYANDPVRMIGMVILVVVLVLYVATIAFPGIMSI